jgi:hypothetical protein
MANHEKIAPDSGWVYAAKEGVGSTGETATVDNSDFLPCHEFALNLGPQLDRTMAQTPYPAAAGHELVSWRPTYSGKSYLYEVTVTGSSDLPAHDRAFAGGGLVPTYANPSALYQRYDAVNHIDLTDSLTIRQYERDHTDAKNKWKQIVGARHNLIIRGTAGQKYLVEMDNGIAMVDATAIQDQETAAKPTLAWPAAKKYILQGATLTLGQHKSSSPLSYSGMLPSIVINLNRELELEIDGGTNGSGGEVNGGRMSQSVTVELELLDQLINTWDGDRLLADGDRFAMAFAQPGPATATNVFGFAGYFQLVGIGEPVKKKSVYRTCTFEAVWPDTDYDFGTPDALASSPNYDERQQPGIPFALYHKSAA